MPQKAQKGARQLNALNKAYSFFISIDLSRVELATCPTADLGDGKFAAGKRQASRLLLGALRSGRNVTHAEGAVDAEAAVEGLADAAQLGGDDDDDDDAVPDVVEQGQR